jgi:hypothetical protein
MTRTIAIVIGVVVGLVIGLLSERVPVRPVLQSILASLVGFTVTVASVASAAVWLKRPPPDGETWALSFGLSESLLLWAGVLVVGVALLHAALGWVGSVLHPFVAMHRIVLVALLISLSAAMASISGLGMAGLLR